MSSKNIHLKISTPTGVFLEKDVDELIAPGKAGYFGIEKDHTPFISAIMSGKLSVFDKGAQEDFALHNGFLVVSDNLVNILTETIERPGEIDESRAESAKERAKKRLREKEQETDLRRAEAALQRSVSRLDVAAN